MKDQSGPTIIVITIAVIVEGFVTIAINPGIIMENIRISTVVRERGKKIVANMIAINLRQLILKNPAKSGIFFIPFKPFQSLPVIPSNLTANENKNPINDPGNDMRYSRYGIQPKAPWKRHHRRTH